MGNHGELFLCYWKEDFSIYEELSETMYVFHTWNHVSVKYKLEENFLFINMKGEIYQYKILETTEEKLKGVIIR